MIPNFDDAIALTTDDDIDADRVRWHANLTADWSIGQVPNGGYTGAMLVNALQSHTGASIPVSLTTHYYRPAIHDAPCIVRTEITKRGRTVTHADAVLEQEGKVRCRSVALMGDYPAADTILPTTPPDIPPPDSCVARDPMAQGFNMSLLESVDVRLDPACVKIASADASGQRIDGWAKFSNDRPNDSRSLALFVDAFPPVILITVPETGWVPTLEMTTHVRAEPAPGWIRGEITTANVRGGTLIEDVRLWDSTNTLVAEARQIALAKPPS